MRARGAPNFYPGRTVRTGRRREDAIAVVQIPGCKEASEGRPDFALRIKYAEALHGRSWIVKSRSSGLTRSQNSSASRSERSRGASMGSDSLLQGDFSTTLEMTSRDWGILRSRIQPVE